MRCLSPRLCCTRAGMHLVRAMMATLCLALATAMPVRLAGITAAHRPLHCERAHSPASLSIVAGTSTSAVFILCSMIIGCTPPPRSRPPVVTSSPTCSPVRILSKYSRATYRMHGMSLSTPVKDTVSRVAVAVAVAVAVSRVRVHRLAAISASGRERASVPSLPRSFRVSPTLAAADLSLTRT